MKFPRLVATRALLALGLNLVLPSPAPSQTFEQKVDRYVASFSAHDGFNGVILAAVGDSILIQKGYGLASLESGVPTGPGTPFQVGSLAKAFTAILTLKLVDRGVLRLDGTISDYLPDYPVDPGKRITIRQLLTHTSGIPHHVDAVPDYFVSHDKVFHTPRELWESFARVPLAHEPGKQFTYSSPGYYVLGAILQRVTGKSYAELLRESIFGPLGMKDSRVENNRAVQRGMATGYMRGLSGLVRAGFEDKSTALAAGDLVTTARDLFLWDRGMKSGRGAILSAESMALLFQPGVPGEARTPGGWFMSIPIEGKTLRVSRLTGSSTGYSAAMDRMLEPDACVIVLSNVQDTETAKILDDVSDFLLRDVLGIAIGNAAPATVTPPPAAAVDPADVAKVLGFYRSPAEGTLGVVREEGRLYLLRYGSGRVSQPILEMVPQAPDSFALGHSGAVACRSSAGGKPARPALSIVRRGRSGAAIPKIESGAGDVSEYGGAYASVELQRSFRFSAGPTGLTAEKWLGGADVVLIRLEKDLFGFERGFIRFTRSVNGEIAGFTLLTRDTDTFFGSRFVKL